MGLDLEEMGRRLQAHARAMEGLVASLADELGCETRDVSELLECRACAVVGETYDVSAPMMVY